MDSGVSLEVGAVKANREEGILISKRAEIRKVKQGFSDFGCSVKSTT